MPVVMTDSFSTFVGENLQKERMAMSESGAMSEKIPPSVQKVTTTAGKKGKKKHIHAKHKKRYNKAAVQYVALDNELKDKWKECNTVEEQMKLLQDSVQISEEQMGLVDSIKERLTEIFTQFFPGCEVISYGNASNGLGMKNCELEFYLELNLDKNLTPLQMEGYPKAALPDVAGLAHLTVENGMLTRDSLRNISRVDMVKLLVRIMKQPSDKEFSNVMSKGPFLKLPGLQFKHTSSGCKCAVFTCARALLARSNLLQFYSDFDPRFKTLFYTLYKWLRMSDKNGEIKLGSYAMCLLVIHYLSGLNPPALPTVAHLAQLADTKEIIDGKDFSLQTKASKVTFKRNNKMKMGDLLAGFFQYFSSVNYDDKVISSRTGILEEKANLEAEKIEEQNIIQEEPKLKSKSTSMVILDPFTLSHASGVITIKHVKEHLLKAFITASVKVQQPSFKKKQPDGLWGLNMLLESEPATEEEMRDVETKQMMRKINVHEESPFNLPIYLPEGCQQPGSDQQSFVERWCSELLAFLQRCLQEILLLDVIDLDIDQTNGDHENGSVETSGTLHNPQDPNRKRKSDAPVSTDDPKKLKSDESVARNVVHISRCSAYFRTWQNRTKVRKQIRSETAPGVLADEFAFESEITRVMTQTIAASDEPLLEYYIVFNFDKTAAKPVLKLSMHPTVGKKEFSCFFPFLVSFVAKMVSKSFTMET